MRDNETGLLVPDKDEKALAEAVVRILTDQPLAERLGRAGQRHVQEAFGRKHICDEFEVVYSAALKNHATGNAMEVSRVRVNEAHKRFRAFPRKHQQVRGRKHTRQKQS